MYGDAQDILDAVRAVPTVLQTLLGGQLPTSVLRSGADGGEWSVVEVVCHLRDAEERALERVRAMRDRETPVIAAYDQDEWARERNYAAADLREALASFVRTRAEYVAELEALRPEEWERGGDHESQGPMTIRTHAIHMVAHDLVHAAQISRQVSRVAAGSTVPSR